MNTIHYLVFLILMLPRPSPAQGIVIVVNKENPISHLSKEDLRRIYLGDYTTWTDGSSVRIVDWKTDTDTRNRFYSVVMKTSPAIVKRKWLEKVIIGSIQPPVLIFGESELMEYVAAHKDAIGYIGAESVNAGLKVILIDSMRVMSTGPVRK